MQHQHLVRTIVSAGELKLQKNVCNIMDLEVNQKIYESHLGDGVMDKCVGHWRETFVFQQRLCTVMWLFTVNHIKIISGRKNTKVG